MTGINWTDVTWNPVRGCSRVSEGCRHCYAEQQAARIVRMSRGKPSPYDGLVKLSRDGYAAARWTGKVVLDASKLADPLRWRKPRRVFVNSMSDLFHESLSNEQIAAVFGVMAAAPQHTFQILTKRARRMREWFEWIESTGDINGTLHVAAGEHLADLIGNDEAQDEDDCPAIQAGHRICDAVWPLPNVHLGVSVENQDAADERIPDLLATPAAVRWLSCEPLLSRVELRKWVGRPARCTTDVPCRACADNDGTPCRFSSNLPELHWVVAGCESGPGARPAQVAWFRSLRDQCAGAGVAFWLKQAVGLDVDDGEPEYEDDWQREQRLQGVTASHGSKRKPGGIIDMPYLDGVQHAEMPKGGV